MLFVQCKQCCECGTGNLVGQCLCAVLSMLLMLKPFYLTPRFTQHCCQSPLVLLVVPLVERNNLFGCCRSLKQQHRSPLLFKQCSCGCSGCCCWILSMHSLKPCWLNCNNDGAENGIVQGQSPLAVCWAEASRLSQLWHALAIIVVLYQLQMIMSTVT